MNITIDYSDSDSFDMAWLLDAFCRYLNELIQYDNSYKRIAKWAEENKNGLEKWLLQDELHFMIIKADDAPAGFALVARKPFPYMGPNSDYRMGEFYIGPEYRGRKIGSKAAKKIFRRFPGKWEVTEIPDNHKAIQFWRGVIGDVTCNNYFETLKDGKIYQTFSASGA